MRVDKGSAFYNENQILAIDWKLSFYYYSVAGLKSLSKNGNSPRQRDFFVSNVCCQITLGQK